MELRQAASKQAGQDKGDHQAFTHTSKQAACCFQLLLSHLAYKRAIDSPLCRDCEQAVGLGTFAFVSHHANLGLDLGIQPWHRSDRGRKEFRPGVITVQRPNLLQLPSECVVYQYSVCVMEIPALSRPQFVSARGHPVQSSGTRGQLTDEVLEQAVSDKQAGIQRWLACRPRAASKPPFNGGVMRTCDM